MNENESPSEHFGTYKKFLTQIEIREEEMRNSFREILEGSSLSNTQINDVINNAIEKANELNYDADYDRLNGFFSSEHHRSTIKRALEECKKGRKVAYADMDIGNLGGLNDYCGDKSLSDKYLGDIAAIINENLSVLPNAQLFRHGGDEFSVIVPDCSKERLDKVLERAAKEIQEYAKENGLNEIYHPKAKANIGIGFYGGAIDLDGNKDVHDNIRAAEEKTCARKDEQLDKFKDSQIEKPPTNIDVVLDVKELREAVNLRIGQIKKGKDLNDREFGELFQLERINRVISLRKIEASEHKINLKLMSDEIISGSEIISRQCDAIISQLPAHNLERTIRPAEPPRGKFLNGSEVLQDTLSRAYAADLQSKGVSAQEAQELASKMMDSTSKHISTQDRLTGLSPESFKRDALNRAMQECNNSGRQFAYAQISIYNLGGLNHELGANDRANDHIKAIAGKIQEAFKDLPAAQIFRSGGQFSVLVPDKAGEDVDKVLKEASKLVKDYAAKEGLDKFAHPKTGEERGLGIYYGVDTFNPKKSINENVQEADRRAKAAEKIEQGGKYGHHNTKKEISFWELAQAIKIRKTELEKNENKDMNDKVELKYLNKLDDYIVKNELYRNQNPLRLTVMGQESFCDKQVLARQEGSLLKQMTEINRCGRNAFER